ncbi:hypothetical protein F5146DRAFT_1134020 [Armillaria mellea]|nr:hypothetical protein F5146DRAFT_1134020 [Armillaria mellea]
MGLVRPPTHKPPLYQQQANPRGDEPGIAELARLVAELQRDSEMFSKKIDAVKGETEELRVDIERLGMEAERLKRNVEGLEGTLKGLKRDIEDLQVETYRLQKDSMNSSRKGYVSGTTTVRQLKAAAAEYLKQDIVEDRNIAEFSNARVFVSENGPIALAPYEPDDTLKIKTVCSEATASGFVFVPALPTETGTKQEATAGNNSNIHDMLGQMMKAGNDTTIASLRDDNATLMERIQALEATNASLKQENDDLSRENKALVEKSQSCACH